MNNHKTVHKSGSFVVSFVVMVVLTVITVAEFYVGTHFPSVVFLMLISIVKAVLVLVFYMHVRRLWEPSVEN